MPTANDLTTTVDNSYADDPNDASRKLHQIDHDILRDLTRMAWAGVRPKTGNYTVEITDAGWMIEVNSATNLTMTIPDNTTGWPNLGGASALNGYVIGFCQIGTGTVTIGMSVAGAVKSRDNALRLAGRYAEAMIRMRGTNDWILSGDLIV